MKALSIRQPWAWLIVAGYKDIENRTWKTNHRGPFLVAASQKRDEEGMEWLWQEAEKAGIVLPEEFPTGGIVGEAVLVDCVTESDSLWFVGPYGFVLRDAKPLPFRPYRGKLNFYEVEEP